jgi:hypothetical protein
MPGRRIGPSAQLVRLVQVYPLFNAMLVVVVQYTVNNGIRQT